jgi:hypothetical protein
MPSARLRPTKTRDKRVLDDRRFNSGHHFVVEEDRATGVEVTHIDRPNPL